MAVVSPVELADHAIGVALFAPFAYALDERLGSDVECVTARSQRIGPRDLIIFTADHGNDPTDGSTDHTREFVPLLVGGLRAAGVDLGDRDQYSDIAATIAEAMDLARPTRGDSFLAEIT